MRTPKGYIGSADLHLTDKTPRYRKDDYFKTGLRKFEWIIDLSNSLDYQLLVSGDFFDSATVGYGVVNPVIEILKTAVHKPIVIAGQHDMVNHLEDLKEAPLWNLFISGHIHVIGQGDLGLMVRGPEGHTVQGQQWNAKEPKEASTILMVHRSITQGEPPFFLSDAISDTDALKLYSKYRIVVSGDYHVPFHSSNGVTDIINCGPMLRDSKDKMNLEPCVWAISLTDGKHDIRRINIPIQKAEDVFDVAAIEYDAKNTVTVDTSRLVELVGEGVDALDFEQIVYHVYDNSEFTYLTKEDVQQELMGM